MKILLTLIVMSISVAVYAQEDTMHFAGTDTTKEFKTVQIEAQFPGGVKG